MRNASDSDEHFERWIARLEARHLADLRFSEVSRALRALSSTYVERRGRIAEGAALSGSGKRAAFAIFYGPLHFLLLREIVLRLPAATDVAPTLIDLGCGTGASAAAWATICPHRPAVVGIDRHRWALEESAQTFRDFELSARTRLADIATAPMPNGRSAFLAAFALNELADEARDAVLGRLLHRASGGDQILIVEPLAGFVAPWWSRWAATFQAAGGRADEWRVRVPLPAIVAKLDRAAGLNHRELTGRSLSVNL